MTHSGKDYLKAAHQNGLATRMGSGDHCIVKGPAGRGYEVIPLKKELSSGIDRKLDRWFKSLGIIVPVLMFVIYVLKG